jgi:hypothetical protein
MAVNKEKRMAGAAMSGKDAHALAKQNARAVTKLKQESKKRKKKERFLVARMWFATAVSALYNDRGVIPPNIGNNIYIGNNMYTTKNSLNAVIIVKELSTDTPVAVVSDLIAYVKGKVPNVSVDFTLKCRKHYVNIHGSDLKSRIITWTRTLDNPLVQDYQKRRAARLLYTVDIIKSGERIYKSHIYITLRAAVGSDLNKAIEQTETYLQKISAVYKVIKNDIKSHMEYMLLMSDKRSQKIRDFTTSILSRQTLSEMLPTTQGMNDSIGTFLGIDRESQAPYFINFRGTAKAKNIYIAATSGSGKTFLAQNWFLDMSVDDYNMCIMDLKGTEFIAFTEARGGIVLSMKPSSDLYINTFRLDPSECENKDKRIYYDNRFNLSKEMMLLLCDLPQDFESRGEALLEEFLALLYLSYGVKAENINTWERSSQLTPYVVFDEFTKFLSKAIRDKYQDVADRMHMRLSIYMSRTGSNSHMFRTPIKYKDVLDTKVLTFNFGMLDSGTNTDRAMFRVRALFMSLLNDEYISYKASKGEWTGKVLEESGIADDYLLKLYAKDFMLRRSQNQVTILLGNSVSALADNDNAKGILENINILVIGVLHRSSRRYLIEEYGLDKYRDKLELIHDAPDYENTFLLVNRMEKDATIAMLKAFIPERVVKGRLFRIVDTED